MRKAIFLDKDGTLIEDIPYNVDARLIRFPEGCLDALKSLQASGYLLIVISNQSGVAHGYFSEADLINLKRELTGMLQSSGIRLDAFYFCPHHPKGKIERLAVHCDCRKPNPGMILRAADQFNINLTHSWMIGDILNDVEAGNRAGCRTILINNGNETEWETAGLRQPTLIVKSLKEAAAIITNERELV